MRKLSLILATALAATIAFGGVQASADRDGTGRFAATLSGYEEVPTLSVDGSGNFSAQAKGGQIAFSLSWTGLTGDATAAHIHLGRTATVGGVGGWICGGGGQPACPTGTSASITGTIVAANVTGPVAQGIDAGDIEELIAAMAVGATYVNVHTVAFPPGEIRGQIG